MRRSRRQPSARVTRIGTLRIDHAARDVRIGNTPVSLAAKEYALLVQLASDPARVFTKDELMRDVWGFRTPARSRTVDSHAIRLRHKLTDAGDARFIQNVWGVGYRLIAPAERHQPYESAA